MMRLTKKTEERWRKVRDGRAGSRCMLNRSGNGEVFVTVEGKPVGSPCPNTPTELWELSGVEYAFCLECRQKIVGLVAAEKTALTKARKAKQEKMFE